MTSFKEGNGVNSSSGLSSLPRNGPAISFVRNTLNSGPASGQVKFANEFYGGQTSPGDKTTKSQANPIQLHIMQHIVSETRSDADDGKGALLPTHAIAAGNNDSNSNNNSNNNLSDSYGSNSNLNDSSSGDLPNQGIKAAVSKAEYNIVRPVYSLTHVHLTHASPKD